MSSLMDGITKARLILEDGQSCSFKASLSKSTVELYIQECNQSIELVSDDWPKLKKLDVSDVGLVSFPILKGKGWQLSEINASRNSISEVLFEKSCESRVDSLSHLYLSRNEISSIVGIYDAFPNLVILNVRRNRLKCLDDFVELIRLNELDVSENNLSEISSKFGNITNLKKLHISGNRVAQFPKALCKLTKLESLALSGNKIEYLEDEFLHLTKLQELWIYDNPLKDPPSNVAIEGLKQIRAYISARQTGHRALVNRSRVIIVGQVNAGKTTLASRLLNKEPPEIRTPTSSPVYGQISSEIELWDMGGEAFMFAIQRAFFTNSSILVLVLDRFDSRVSSIWCRKIFNIGLADRTIIAVNKVDKNQRVALDFQLINQLFKPENIFDISALEGLGITALLNRINFLHHNDNETNVPIRWVKVYNALARNESLILTTEDYFKNFQNFGLSESEMDSFLSICCRVFGVTPFKGKFNSLIAMDSFLVCKYMHSIVISPIIKKFNGVVSTSILSDILVKKGLQNVDANLIIDASIKSFICAKVGKDKLVVPDLLPKFTDLEEVRDDEGINICIQYLSDSVFVLNRIICAFAKFVNWARSARTFHVCEVDNDTLITFKADQSREIIEIRCYGVNRINASFEVRKLVREILGLLGENNNIYLNAGEEIGLIDYDDAIGSFLMGQRYYIIGKRMLKIPLNDLLFGVNHMSNEPNNVFHINNSAVSFGSGNANYTNNWPQIREYSARLIDQLEKVDEGQLKDVRSSIEEASAKEDINGLKNSLSVLKEIAGLPEQLSTTVSELNSFLSSIGF